MQMATLESTLQAEQCADECWANVATLPPPKKRKPSSSNLLRTKMPGFTSQDMMLCGQSGALCKHSAIYQGERRRRSRRTDIKAACLDPPVKPLPHPCRCVLIKDRRRTQAKRAYDGADEEKKNNNYVATLVKRARAWVFEKSRAGRRGGGCWW